MAVTFKIPVVATGTRTVNFTLTGVTSGQPIVLFVARGLLATVSVSDTFSTPYIWTAVTTKWTEGAGPVYIGTGGRGTSGIVTFDVGYALKTGGVAVACVGASTASGTAAIDHSYAGSGSTSSSGLALVTPSFAGDGVLLAVYVGKTAATITSTPGSPWVNTAFTGISTRKASLAGYAGPPSGDPLTPVWDFSEGTGWGIIGLLVKEASVPSPPLYATAYPGNGKVQVDFVAPANNGGAPVTSYTVTASPGGATATGSSTSITVMGLANGTSYTFTVKATNSSGTSTASAVSNAAVPGTVPDAPTIVSAGSAATSAILQWDPPETDGGTAVTAYRVYQGTSHDGESSTPVATVTATSFTVTGLTNLTTYYFTVKAVNGWGTSAASNEAIVTPAVAVTPNMLTAPTLAAQASTDPRTGEPIVNLTVTNHQIPATGVAPTMLVSILRTDSTYVLGASPASPLSVPTGTSVTVVDRTAAYGVTSTYVAYLTYGGATSAPSPAAKAVMGQAPDTTALYRRLGWAKDEDATGELLAWLSGIGAMVQPIDNLCRDGFDADGNPAPGWSQVLDIDRAPTEVLPWLAQFLGVRLNTNLRDDQQRFAIENPQGFGRGTVTAILSAANLYLKPGYSAVIIERDTSAYHLAIHVPASGIAGLSTCESVFLTYTTCSALAAAFPACSTLWKIPAEIDAAMGAAIPAGLVAAISYD